MVAQGARTLAGRYRVGAPLGQGGSSCVFDGYDTRLERPVAIKELRPEMAVDAAMRCRFAQEARTAARLTHPNAVAVYDTGEDDGRTFLVMERLPGRTLADRIARGPLPAAEVAAVGADVLGVLRAAHALGLVHRDVKPGNILLTDDGQAKVGDFGVATRMAPPASATADERTADEATADEADDRTETGRVIGTPAYLAPERLEGHRATARADLFAVGVVLFEALTGRKPGPSPTSVPGAPPTLAAVVLRALAPRPEDRYASAAEMAGALHAVAGLPTARATAAFGEPAAPPRTDAPQPDATILPGASGAVPGTKTLLAAWRADHTVLLRARPRRPALRSVAMGGSQRWLPRPGTVSRSSGPRTAATRWRNAVRRLPVVLGVVGVVAGLTGVALLVVAMSGGATRARPATTRTASPTQRSPASPPRSERSSASSPATGSTTTTPTPTPTTTPRAPAPTTPTTTTTPRAPAPTTPTTTPPTTPSTLGPSAVSRRTVGGSGPGDVGAGDPKTSGPGAGSPAGGGPGARQGQDGRGGGGSGGGERAGH